MKNYIDCGSFQADTINAYPFPEYRRIAFDCNPLLRHVQHPEDVIVKYEAVWINNNILKFYVNPDNINTEGCTLFRDKTTGDLDKTNYYYVKGIDFSKWLFLNVVPDNYTIVKMNIEGAEYKVLEHCIMNDTIHLIDELIVYWHKGKIPSITDTEHNHLIKDLEKIFDDKLHSFY
jgi:hypothetical protein